MVIDTIRWNNRERKALEQTLMSQAKKSDRKYRYTSGIWQKKPQNKTKTNILAPKRVQNTGGDCSYRQFTLNNRCLVCFIYSPLLSCVGLVWFLILKRRAAWREGTQDQVRLHFKVAERKLEGSSIFTP